MSTGIFDASRFPSLADLSVRGGGAALRIKYSKTRQAADGGFWAPFLRVEEGPCPVRVAQQLRDRAVSRTLDPGSPLFAALGGGGGGEEPHLPHAGSGPLVPQALPGGA